MPRVSDIQLYTDASLSGGGAHCPTLNLQTMGRWNTSEAKFHINYLELLAVFYEL